MRFSPAFLTSPVAFNVRLPQGNGIVTQNVLGRRYHVGGANAIDLPRTEGGGDEFRFGRGGGVDTRPFTSGERGRRPVDNEGELLLLEMSESRAECESLPPERDADMMGAFASRLTCAYDWDSSSSSDVELSLD